MKAGDLVKYKSLHGYVVAGEFISKQWVGVVLEELPGALKVFWSTGTVSEETRSSLKMIK